MGQEQLGYWAEHLISVSVERTDIGEVLSLVWGCAAGITDTGGKKTREGLENKIQADACWNPGYTT